jgi:GPH family glycoside/pentoside/hexuronide:cation symporter
MPPPPAPEPSSSASERVPTRTKLFYAAPSLAEVALGMPIYVWLPKFYADHLLVPVGMMALAIAIARATDAITDPIMGWVSDRTRTRWGRRRPYILAGGLLAPLAYVMLFAPPAWLTPAQAGLWFSVGFTSLFLFGTIATIPTQALGAELSSDYHERTRIFGLRSVFLMLGTLLGSVLPWAVDGGLGMPASQAMPLVAISLACVIWTLKILLVANVRERPELAARGHLPLVPGVRASFRNRPFRRLLLAYVVSSLSAALTAGLLPFFIGHVLQSSDPSRLLSLTLATAFLSSIATLPLVVRLSRRLGKVPVWRASLVLASLSELPKLWLGPGDDALLIALYVVRGVALSAGFALPMAMLADAVDYDELRTGKRREAQYTALWHIVPKFIAIPGAALPLALLGSLGYVAGSGVQSPEIVWWLRVLFAFPGFLSDMVAAWIARTYPITPAIHRDLLEVLSARRRGEEVIDPVSGSRLTGRLPHAASTVVWLDALSRTELQRAATGGARALPQRVAGWLALFLAIMGSGALLTGCSVGGLVERPGLAPVLGVVLAGIGLTGALFHAARLGAARRVARGEIEPATLESHLASIDADTQDTNPIRERAGR